MPLGAAAASTVYELTRNFSVLNILKAD